MRGLARVPQYLLSNYTRFTHSPWGMGRTLTQYIHPLNRLFVVIQRIPTALLCCRKPNTIESYCDIDPVKNSTSVHTDSTCSYSCPRCPRWRITDSPVWHPQTVPNLPANSAITNPSSSWHRSLHSSPDCAICLDLRVASAARRIPCCGGKILLHIGGRQTLRTFGEEYIHTDEAHDHRKARVRLV